MTARLIVLSCLIPTLQGVERVELRIDTRQARAVLAFANGTGAWSAVSDTEGYARLMRREAQMGRAAADEEFQKFADSQDLKKRVPALRATLNRWSKTNVDQLASRVLAYLPPQARIQATVYVVVKARSNNFIFDASTKPAVFLYLDPNASREEFRNTVIHELHHIGLASLADDYKRVYATLEPNVRAAAEWLGAFGEGLAMLAAAGGPAIHPHQHSAAIERARWDKAVAGFGADLRKVETFLVDVLQGQLDAEQQRVPGMAFFDVQGPWYTVGWKMAATVEKDFGRSALIECMNDLRLLLVRYNEAARGRGLPAWSERLIAELGVPRGQDVGRAPAR